MSELQAAYPWFALNVKSRHEKVVSAAIRSKGYPEFLPLYTSQHRSGGRMQSVELPLFPTYLFSSFDPMNRLPLLTIPGVLSILGFGKHLVPVDPAELEAVERVIQSRMAIAPWPYMEIGDSVRIVQGVLAGLQGNLAACKGKCRVVVSVTLLHRSVSVEVNREWVQPAPQAIEITPGADGACRQVA